MITKFSHWFWTKYREKLFAGRRYETGTLAMTIEVDGIEKFQGIMNEMEMSVDRLQDKFSKLNYEIEKSLGYFTHMENISQKE